MYQEHAHGNLNSGNKILTIPIRTRDKTGKNNDKPKTRKDKTGASSQQGQNSNNRKKTGTSMVKTVSSRD